MLSGAIRMKCFISTTVSGAVAPAVRIGSVCHELWPDTCSNCPLLSIGDRESHTTVSYNDPFGGMVDITATRMLWAEGIPAYIITVGPHTLTRREQELEWGRRRMLQAISYVYSMVIYVNLTRNRFFMVEYERFDTKQAPDEGNFDELIEIGAQTMHPDFREQFKNTFGRKQLLERFANGETNIYMEHRPARRRWGIPLDRDTGRPRGKPYEQRRS